jgi:hypothetical protein
MMSTRSTTTTLPPTPTRRATSKPSKKRAVKKTRPEPRATLEETPRGVFLEGVHIRFVISLGPLSADERVVEETTRHAVVEKVGPSAETAIPLDRRTNRAEGRRS